MNKSRRSRGLPFIRNKFPWTFPAEISGWLEGSPREFGKQTKLWWLIFACKLICIANDPDEWTPGRKGLFSDSDKGKAPATCRLIHGCTCTGGLISVGLLSARPSEAQTRFSILGSPGLHAGGEKNSQQANRSLYCLRKIQRNFMCCFCWKFPIIRLFLSKMLQPEFWWELVEQIKIVQF